MEAVGTYTYIKACRHIRHVGTLVETYRCMKAHKTVGTYTYIQACRHMETCRKVNCDTQMYESTQDSRHIYIY